MCLNPEIITIMYTVLIDFHPLINIFSNLHFGWCSQNISPQPAQFVFQFTVYVKYLQFSNNVLSEIHKSLEPFGCNWS